MCRRVESHCHKLVTHHRIIVVHSLSSHEIGVAFQQFNTQPIYRMKQLCFLFCFGFFWSFKLCVLQKFKYEIQQVFQNVKKMVDVLVH
jgi:hypothetical protein